MPSTSESCGSCRRTGASPTRNWRAGAGLSPAACFDRVKRLRASGVIAGYTALLDPAKLGQALLIFVEVVLDRTTDDVFTAFAAQVGDIPEVLECHMVAGGFDYLLKVRVADMAAYRRFLGRDPDQHPRRARDADLCGAGRGEGDDAVADLRVGHDHGGQLLVESGHLLAASFALSDAYSALSSVVARIPLAKAMSCFQSILKANRGDNIAKPQSTFLYGRRGTKHRSVSRFNICLSVVSHFKPRLRYRRDVVLSIADNRPVSVVKFRIQ